MSHLVLYRNFRPQTFDQVIGQNHIVTTLKNQVKNNSFGHAYLFCGTRGTGKTSTAKIFARAVNCLSSVDGNPCGKCSACESNLNGGNLDIVEIDAASNNRVDEIRDLREKIGYLPSVNKFKVYIVDEVHMLTDSAFNALLKTLEEPPAHALFILATTEPHKLPATILSRCMRFDFKLVSEQDLVSHLKNVFKQSDITCDGESLKLIADAGEGSVRDTLSVAEMCSAFCNNNITYDQCLKCLGITDSATILSLSKCLVNNDAKTLLQILDSLKNQGKNFSIVVKDLSSAIDTILSLKIAGTSANVNLPQNIISEYNLLAQNCSENKLLSALQTLTELDYKLKLSSSIEQLVETAMLSIIFSSSAIDDLNARLTELEKKTLIASKSNKNLVDTNSQQNEQDDTYPKQQNDINKKQQNALNDAYKTKQDETNSQQKFDDVEYNAVQTNLQQDQDKAQTKANVVETEYQNMDSVDFNSNKQKNASAKKVLGELLIALRQQSLFVLYSVLGDVKDVEISGDKLVLKAEQEVADTLKDNQKKLEQQLKIISPNLSLNILPIEQSQTLSTKEFLIERFDNNIKIVD